MTRMITYNENEEHPLPIEEIKDVYQRGRLFVYPTETLYGLGVDPSNIDALERLCTLKQRPKDMPISVAVSNISMMKGLGEVNPNAERMVDHFLPGPVTILLKALDDVPRVLTKDSRIGLRIPDHPVPLKIIENTGPITATSANIHGSPGPYNIEEAIKQLGDGVDIYIDSGESKFKGPSTIVDCSGNSISIIRKGVIPEREILALYD